MFIVTHQTIELPSQYVFYSPGGGFRANNKKYLSALIRREIGDDKSKQHSETFRFLAGVSQFNSYLIYSKIKNKLTFSFSPKFI